MIDLAAIAQIATVLVIGAGYWFLYRSNVHMFREMRGQRDAVGRPQVIVTDNYGDLPLVSIVVCNVSGGRGAGYRVRLLRSHTEFRRFRDLRSPVPTGRYGFSGPGR